MKIIYFDTETTGLSAGPLLGGKYFGKICQLSYIILDNGAPKAKNFFFNVEYVEPSASEVTGLTPEKLAVLSGGRVFADDADEIHDDFISADFIVAHNFSFDQKFMETEFNRLGMRFEYKRSICSMRSTVDFLKIPGWKRYKMPSLAELGSFFGIKDSDVIKKTQELYYSVSIAHDSRFDTVKLMLAVEEGKKYCPNLIELN